MVVWPESESINSNVKKGRLLTSRKGMTDMLHSKVPSSHLHVPSLYLGPPVLRRQSVRHARNAVRRDIYW
ncbi:hypothetical protein VTN00DRAFT_566 [Thermoascus crustaceus]|uniref:uncharacterized protein n=1 Tax=Thermoascus crustaceus TaxID=5088 RepID=UPI00374257C3